MPGQEEIEVTCDVIAGEWVGEGGEEGRRGGEGVESLSVLVSVSVCGGREGGNKGGRERISTCNPALLCHQRPSGSVVRVSD